LSWRLLLWDPTATKSRAFRQAHRELARHRGDLSQLFRAVRQDSVRHAPAGTQAGGFDISRHAHRRRSRVDVRVRRLENAQLVCEQGGPRGSKRVWLLTVSNLKRSTELSKADTVTTPDLLGGFEECLVQKKRLMIVSFTSALPVSIRELESQVGSLLECRCDKIDTSQHLGSGHGDCRWVNEFLAGVLRSVQSRSQIRVETGTSITIAFPDTLFEGLRSHALVNIKRNGRKSRRRKKTSVRLHCR